MPPARHRPWLELLHFPPIGFVLVAAGSFTVVAARGHPDIGRLGRFLLALLLTQVAISVHNDYCDRELDALAKPWRAVPSRLLGTGQALLICGLLLALGLVTAVTISLTVGGLIALCTSAGLVYNAFLKRSAWTWVAFWLALPTLAVCSFVVAGRTDARLWLAYLIGAPLALAIYLADTLDDVETDRSHGVHGLGQRLGKPRAAAACWLALTISIVLAALLSRQFGAWTVAAGYLLATALTIAAILLEHAGHRRAHWIAVFTAATLVGLDWLSTLIL